MKAIKLIFALLLGLLLLIGVALAALTTLIDPNDYKNEIRNAALEQAGIELKIDGDIGWSFYPWLALELNQIGVSYPNKPALGQLNRAEVSVSIPALIGGELQMNRLLVDGLALELVQDRQGGNNWTPTSPAAGGEAQDQTSGESDSAASSSREKGLSIDIEAIEIRNAALTFTDQANNSRIELSDLNLTSGRISEGEAFPLELGASLRQFTAEQLQLHSRATLETQVTLDLAGNRYQLSGLTSTLELIEGASIPAALKFGLAADLDARLNEQQVDIRQLKIDADPLTLSGELSLSSFSQPQLSGQLSSNTFNLKQLLTTLGQAAPETSDKNALTALAFSATLGGPAGTVQLKPLSLQLDDTQFNGEASFGLDSQQIGLKLKGNALDADRYLPPATETTPSQAQAGSGSSKGWPKDEIIPMEPLRALNLNAELDLESLKINGIQLGKPGLTLAASNGLIKLTRFNTSAFEGQISTTAQLDARKAPLRISLAPRVTGLQLGNALKTLADTDVVAGKLDSRADISMSGQSIHAWVNSLNGSANVQMAEGLLKGIDAAQSMCQGINNLSALWINAEQVDKTTPFADLGANFNMRNGVVSNNDLTARLDAMTVAGRGNVNLPQQALDYRVGLTLEGNLFNESCSVNNRLEGVEVPVNCKGGFYDEPAKLCRLDTSFISNIIKAEAKRKVEEKVGSQVEEKLKEKLGEEGAGQVLKGLFGR
ncbi:AsmA family protein [Marinobacterium sediminicola]|uniref:AsmA protein n=1 Tax=Marinobacterium sediminicola TaxID=518898 RepID=A0ABY1S2X0_9GAMM|nr:AsmA family protein [Marinobacterium sediminicola]ULG69278.1 AsmA family protein [Marinobacterium sediminicola]SMR77627.1 AsmA protein [Marinobacterium sediminicola]